MGESVLTITNANPGIVTQPQMLACIKQKEALVMIMSNATWDWHVDLLMLGHTQHNVSPWLKLALLATVNTTADRGIFAGKRRPILTVYALKNIRPLMELSLYGALLNIQKLQNNLSLYTVNTANQEWQSEQV